MKPQILDVETDIYNNGNPFDPRNKLVCYAYKLPNSPSKALVWDETSRSAVQHLVDNSDFLVGCNFKFDFHWLVSAGVSINEKRIWDVQIAHYVLQHQLASFPSLDDIALHYGFPPKLDIVASKYWANGITTSDIPWQDLEPYAAYDAELTHKVFLKQYQEATPQQRTLIFLYGDDMHVLQEMEQNGLKYDVELCNRRAEELDNKIREIENELSSIYPHVPINFGSNDDLSAFLYGGTIEEVRKVPDGVYKSGQKKGQLKLKNEVFTHHLPRVYEPLPGSELKKKGYYATNEPTLKSLSGNKKIVGRLLELAKLQKLNGTYYRGLPKLNAEMNWEPGTLHGNFNQTQTITGRLSSSKP